MSEIIAKVAISADFLTAFSELPRSIQGKVTEFINKFRNNPRSPGINYEKIENSTDKKICSVRIDDTYRGIVVRQEETGVYLLLWVDHHDEAYQWALRKRCEVNPQTGALQIFDVQSSEHANEVVTKQGIFTSFSRSDLLKLGVPEIQVPFVKSFETKEELFAAKNDLPADAFEALSWLSEGFPIDEVIDLMQTDGGNESVGATEDLSKALERPETLKSFVVVSGEDELRRIMAEPLEKWRVFLHPTQRKIVEKNYSGSARVLGGAGTGKTVVAMHRAKFLASQCSADDRILFTTFTANLASDIKENLKKICTIEELRKIEVIHLDAWVSNYLRELGYTASISYDSEINKLWDDAVRESLTALDFTTSFYEDELNRVVVAQEVFSLAEYVKASRNGRGTRLDRKKRIAVWEVLDEYQKLMKERGIRDINTAMYECKTLLLKNGKGRHYKHIIVDEGQDLSDNAYRLIRALSGEEHENDIFIVGDSHQRIYKNHAILSKCGINIRGRSSTLKINYRTTEEIRKYAFALLNGIDFDDLDEGKDPGDRCQSLTHGIKPIVRKFDNSETELDYIVNEIRKLVSSGEPINNICVVGRTHRIIEDYISKFTENGIRSYEIRQNKLDDRNYDGIRIATMHRVKGLEFSYVFIVAANNRIIPLPSAIDHTDSISEHETMTSEKCLLYVALTRAQKGAYITCYGSPSEFLI